MADDERLRSHLDLDELDIVESERAGEATLSSRLRRLLLPASREDLALYKRLMQYVTPYWPKVLFAVLLSVIGGGMVVVQLKLLQRALQVVGNEGASLKDLAGGTTPGVVPTVNQPDPAATVPTTPKVPDPATPGSRDSNPPVTSAPLSLTERRDALTEVALYFLAVVLFGSLIKFVQTMMMTGVSRKAIRHLREDCFKNLVRLPLRFHQRTHSAKVVARVTKDINRLRELLVSFSISGSKEVCIFFAALFVAVSTTSLAALFAVVFVLLAILPIRYIADKMRHRDKLAEAGSGDMFAILTEMLAGQKVVKTFLGERHEIRRFKSATRVMYRRQMETYRLRALTEPCIDIVAGLGIAGAIWFLGSWVIDGDLVVSELALVLFALQKLNSSVRKMGKLQNDFVRGVIRAERVVKLLDQVPELTEAPNAIPLDRFERTIEFCDVRFSYQEDVPVLRGVSLTIRRGETVAIVGPSGSGKTSLVDLVPRLYDVDEGSISIDGRDLREYTLKSLREQIATVTQETILFRDTIRENIAYGIKVISEDAVIAAAKAANAHDFIAAKPGGYDTPLGERGLRLSGGERQRIAIARAILKNPPILILDEATSALDAEAEASVQGALEYLMEGRTTLVIAHRLSTIRRADRIVVLNQGEVVEQGTHDELIALDGRYARAYRMQSEAHSRGDEDGPIDAYFGETEG